MVIRILLSIGLSAGGTIRQSLTGGGSTWGVVSGLLVKTVVLTDPLVLGFTYFLPRTLVMAQDRVGDLYEFSFSCKT